jgi:hypothetical protein
MIPRDLCEMNGRELLKADPPRDTQSVKSDCFEISALFNLKGLALK